METKRSANVAQFLVDLAAEQPDKIAVVQPLKHDRNGKRQYKTITFRELDEDSRYAGKRERRDNDLHGSGKRGNGHGSL